jgi:hypothetical protein
MKNVFQIIALLICVAGDAQQTSFKFDFGSGKIAPGYIQITPASKFSYQTGYGFDQNSVVESFDRGGNPLTGDFITGKKPFYFSVKLPEGNYDVKTFIRGCKRNIFNYYSNRMQEINAGKYKNSKRKDKN